MYEDMKVVLYTDSAVAGEAAGIGMGLLMVGTASEKASEMLAYAHDTQHEKIIRSVLFNHCCGMSEDASSSCSDISLYLQGFGTWHRIDSVWQGGGS